MSTDITNHMDIDRLIQRLKTLAQVSNALAIDLHSEDLKLRCEVLSKGIEVAVKILKNVTPELVIETLNKSQTAITMDGTKTVEIETRLLCELAAIAMNSGFHEDGFILIEAVGTVLHGQLGGAVFKIEALLAAGRIKEASTIYKQEILNSEDFALNAEAIFLSLWIQRGHTLWSTVNESKGRH